MNTSAASPFSSPLSPAWTTRTAALNPVIEHAARSGRLAQGGLDDLVSPEGIKLPRTPSPVILLKPQKPIRAPKFRPTARFEGGEHTAIGDNALLYFSDCVTGQPSRQMKLVLPNGLALTYGQIVSLGGDFYGIPSAPISDGATAAARKTRFTNAYNSLATDSAATTEAPRILAVMADEIAAVNQALAEGRPASAAYEKLGDTLSAKWNVITGGGSFVSPWYPLGRYLQLSAMNRDHSGKWAVLAYEAGHAVAIEQARVARHAPPEQRRQLLGQAYAMNAFADHFLSDLFSAGRIRTPGKNLHDEDCPAGLAATKQIGDRWHASGDQRYFDTADRCNRALVDIAVQQSIDDVFLAFCTGKAPAGYAALQRVADLGAAATVGANQAYPTLANIPTAPAGTLARRIYRLFKGRLGRSPTTARPPSTTTLNPAERPAS